MTGFDFALMEVRAELSKATRNFPPINSLHEGYAVTLEELDEAWEEIKRKDRDLLAVRLELIQVAAMAVRTLVDVLDKNEVPA